MKYINIVAFAGLASALPRPTPTSTSASTIATPSLPAFSLLPGPIDNTPQSAPGSDEDPAEGTAPSQPSVPGMGNADLQALLGKLLGGLSGSGGLDGLLGNLPSATGLPSGSGQILGGLKDILDRLPVVSGLPSLGDGQGLGGLKDVLGNLPMASGLPGLGEGEGFEGLTGLLDKLPGLGNGKGLEGLEGLLGNLPLPGASGDTGLGNGQDQPAASKST